jgi:hypothetical protein
MSSAESGYAVITAVAERKYVFSVCHNLGSTSNALALTRTQTLVG